MYAYLVWWDVVWWDVVWWYVVWWEGAGRSGGDRFEAESHGFDALVVGA